MRAWVECLGDEWRGLFLAWAVFLGDLRLLGLFFHTGELCTYALVYGLNVAR